MSKRHYGFLICQSKACIRSNKLKEKASIDKCYKCKWFCVKEFNNPFTKPGKTTGPVIWN